MSFNFDMIIINDWKYYPEIRQIVELGVSNDVIFRIVDAMIVLAVTKTSLTLVEHFRISNTIRKLLDDEMLDKVCEILLDSKITINLSSILRLVIVIRENSTRFFRFSQSWNGDITLIACSEEDNIWIMKDILEGELDLKNVKTHLSNVNITK